VPWSVTTSKQQFWSLFQKRRRPEMEQEIHAPPVQKPREIRAESPSDD